MLTNINRMYMTTIYINKIHIHPDKHTIVWHVNESLIVAFVFELHWHCQVGSSSASFLITSDSPDTEAKPVYVPGFGPAITALTRLCWFCLPTSLPPFLNFEEFWLCHILFLSHYHCKSRPDCAVGFFFPLPRQCTQISIWKPNQKVLKECAIM